MFHKLIRLYMFLFESRTRKMINKYKSTEKSALLEVPVYRPCDSITIQEQNGIFQIIDCSFKNDFPEIEKQLKEKQ